MPGHQVVQIIDDQVCLVRRQVPHIRRQGFHGQPGEDSVGKCQPAAKDQESGYKAPECGQHAVISGPGMEPV